MTTEERIFAAFAAGGRRLNRRLTRTEWLSLMASELAKLKKERKKSGINPDAERVYELYPKKVGREAALLEITKALNKHPLEYLLDKTAQFAACVAAWPTSYRYFQDGGDRVWNPVNFFKDGHYEDEVSEWKRKGSRGAPPPVKPSLPEPTGWREAFPDYIHANSPWNSIDAASQAYICEQMKQRTTA